jgi:hypothetical protein
MRRVATALLAGGVLLLNLVPSAAASVSAYQEVCLIQEGHVTLPPGVGVARDPPRSAAPSSRGSGAPPSENCAQVVVVADVLSCSRMFGEFECKVSFTATMSVSGAGACGTLTGVVPVDLCPTLVTDSASETRTKEYILPPNGGAIREPFELCVTIKGLSPTLLGGASSKCQPFELAAFIAPNGEMEAALCPNVLTCLHDGVPALVAYYTYSAEHALIGGPVVASNVQSIVAGALP